ncbi:MAG: NAD-dependent epimerase/dehydratase family protein [bacterium]|nr:NAD-dependent epimerase/dehydratase family protein [bacterium]
MNDIIERDVREMLGRVDVKKAKGKKVLITGANGLIGQYVVAALSLANRDKRLRIRIDTAGKGAPRAVLKGLMRFDKKISYHRVDLAKPFTLGGYDYIFHAAGYAQPARFVSDPAGTMAVNVDASVRLLEGSPHATFVFFSSAEVYGDIPQKLIPVKEDFNGNSPLHNPRSVYAESKRLGEALCAAYAREKKRSVKIMRISAVYGPGLPKDDARVMSDFIWKALRDKEIRLLDGGRAVRTYGYVADVVAMILFAAFNGREMVYNVGGKDQISILDLAKRIAKETSAKFSIPLAASRLSHIGKDPKVVRLDLSRIRKEMKRLSFTPFKQGLRRTILWSTSTR